MKKNLIKIIAIVTVLLGLFGCTKSKEVITLEVIKSDTILIHDTIQLIDTIYIKEKIFQIDTIYKVHTDTIKETDSILIEQKYFFDPLCEIWASGHNIKLDSFALHFDRAITYSHTTIYRPPKVVLSIGPYVGYGNKGWNYGVCLNLGVPINLINSRTKKDYK